MSAVPDRFARAFRAGARQSALWLGGATLVLTWLAIVRLLLPENGPLGVLVPGAGVLLIGIGGVLMASRVPRSLRAWKAVIALAIMECGFAVYLMTVHLDLRLPHSTAQFGFSFLKFAIVVFTINAGLRWGPAVTAVVAVAISEVLCATVAPALHYPLGFDGPEIVCLLLVLAASVGFALAGRGAARAQLAFQAVQQEEALRRTRQVAVSHTAAVLHDTVLSDLAVLAAAEPGPLDPRVSARLSATLKQLAAPDWGSAPIAAPEGTGGAVRSAVAKAEADGLAVTLSGAAPALARLDPGLEHALGRAVEQCLTNTLRHARVREAEVTVLADDAELSIMVSDEGEGFDVEQVDEDRMGIRGSVRSRVEEAGGRVRIFARPGLGTSVLITVPRTEMAAR